MAKGGVHVLELFTELEHKRTMELKTAVYWTERWAAMGLMHYAQEAQEEAQALFNEVAFLRAALVRLKAH